MRDDARQLTDYELIELFEIYITSATDNFMNFVAVLFAFVVAAYVLGDRMSKPMIAILVSLFTIFSFGVMTAVYVETLWWWELATELEFRGSDLSGRMSYPTAVFAGEVGTYMRYFSYAVFFASYLGGLYFLYEVRKMRAKMNVPPPNKSLETDA